MEYLLIVNFVLFGFLSVVWGSKDWPNFLIKFVFIGMMLLNGVATFQQFGFIVKV